SERRHWSDNVLRALANIARLFQAIGAQCYESEQRIVVGTIDPSVIGEGRTHSAAATATVAPVAAQAHELLVPLVPSLGKLVVIGIVKAAFRCVLDEIERRSGIACLTASTPGRCAAARFTTSCRATGRGCATCRRAARGRLIAIRRRSRLIFRAGLPRERTQSRNYNE